MSSDKGTDMLFAYNSTKTCSSFAGIYFMQKTMVVGEKIEMHNIYLCSLEEKA